MSETPLLHPASCAGRLRARGGPPGDIVERGGALLLREPEGSGERIASMACGLHSSLGTRSIVWVCLQHPASKVRRRLGALAGQVVFVDAVSRPAGIPDGEPGVFHVESPAALHSVLATLHSLLQEGPRVVVWDSINAVLPYAGGDALLRAMSTLNARIHDSRSAVLYRMAEGAVEPRLARSLEGAVDRVETPGAPTWRQVLSLEKPLLYAAMTAMATVNAGLTLVLMRLVHP